MSTYPIETINLTKTFNKRQGLNFYQKIFKRSRDPFNAVDNVTFQANKGEIITILGPNGAGKTTIIKIITGLLKPTSGEVLVNGINPLINKIYIGKILGFMFSNSLLYLRMTVYDNLNYFAKIYDVPNRKQKIAELMKTFELDKWRNEYVENISLGMRCKLNFCRLLITSPKILILDEPTLGLDPINVIKIRNIIKDLKDQNKTIFLATHNMREADQLSDRIALLSKGKIIRMDTPKNLKTFLMAKLKLTIESPDTNEIKKKIIDSIDIEDVIEGTGQIEFMFNNDADKYSQILQIISKYRINHLREQEPDLEEIFFKLLRDKEET